ncbi:pilus assembly protein Flp/PilA [Sphingomonas sp. BE138]|uniref:Flp family type IVb pilin n=1 Tax=Sphingomonas sp. BE138 TaxID=2817845 RepID=UPI0028626D0F|nr:Flp family type IVb pilin [Sphingomonas sp. BE138]MDR6789624.1 pilus assembly protein Flp/PilA [Sphingomonas sp. BE138]
MPRMPLFRSPVALLLALRESRGATAVEYGLIVAVIALSAAGALSALGAPVTGMFASISANLLSAR